ncbi:uncharacterized protein VTP21DRAFT_9670 [Calcarisporiella thermophila]|uniref:uncharacterized protein n=1 Tax=Calcarisporiella thermophila TaxID=911321 RepID=UPI0037437F61
MSNFNTLISSLNSFPSDEPALSSQDSKDLEHELALWTNAQFAFDVPPSSSTEMTSEHKDDLFGFDGLEYLSGLDVDQKFLRDEANNEVAKDNQSHLASTLSSIIQQQQPTSQSHFHNQQAKLASRYPNIVPAPAALSSTQQQLSQPTKPIQITNSNNKRTRPMVDLQTLEQINPDGTRTVIDPDTASRLAAEEDKRRRNTAASARFRIKKKQREQALERTAKEMTAKAEMLEGRVKELEMEIKWLRSLVVEKDPRLGDILEQGFPGSIEVSEKKLKLA